MKIETNLWHAKISLPADEAAGRKYPKNLTLTVFANNIDAALAELKREYPDASYKGIQHSGKAILIGDINESELYTPPPYSCWSDT